MLVAKTALQGTKMKVAEFPVDPWECQRDGDRTERVCVNRSVVPVHALPKGVTRMSSKVIHLGFHNI